MNTRLMNELSDQIFAAIAAAQSDDLHAEHSLDILRAIRYCLDSIFGHLAGKGGREVERLDDGLYEPLTPEQQLKFGELMNEIKQKTQTLNNAVLAIIQKAYVEINISHVVSPNEIKTYTELKKRELRYMFHSYLKEIGHSPESINSTARTMFNYLLLVASMPQRDNIKKYEMRHAYKGAIMFCSEFFDINP